MNLDVKYYLAVFLRRSPIFLLAFGFVSALIVTIAFKLPPVYESEARLLVESSQIPTQLAAPTVDTAAREQLEIIRQRLLTRANMLDLANRFSVFPDHANMTPDEIVAAMRKQTQIVSKSGRDQATTMSVAFEAGSGRVAAGVVNEYVTLILRDSVSLRTGQAQATLEFFQSEVDRLSKDLSDASQKILEFKNAHADALPDTLSFRMQQRSSLQDRLSIVERDIASLKDQKQRLIQLFNATGQVSGASGNRSPEAVQLDALRAQLSEALAVYSPENPKVVLLQSRVAQLEKVVAAQVAANGGLAEQPTATPLDIQTSEIDSRIAQQSQDRTKLIDEIAALSDSIDRTSANSIVLEGLQRDYENVQGQYNAAVDRLATASTGERIEVLSKGQRITVLDSATVPDQPTRPNRVRLAMLGIAAGLVLGLGLVMLIEMLNSTIRRPSDLILQLEITPIGSIPYMRTQSEIFWRRFGIMSALLVTVAGVPAVLYALDTYYLPLDLIIEKLANKVGL